jgi:hypothetical protein
MEVDMTLKIEAGKYYRTRDGRKVGPMRLTNLMSEYPWQDHNNRNYTDIGQFSLDFHIHYRDLIAEWADAPAKGNNMKTGTLKELNVKPGDVVECVVSRYETTNAIKVGDRFVVRADGWVSGPKHATGRAADWRIVSRAPAAPKLWRDMTPEEKGALLLASHEGKVVEYEAHGWHEAAANDPGWYDDTAYRVKPEPVRETVTLWADCLDSVGLQRVGTIDLIDGKPVPGSVKLDEI